jgi:hypothetical protein
MHTAPVAKAAAPITTRSRNGALAAMGVGLVLTVVATIVPFTTSALADHIRAAYPHYSDARVDTAVTTWLVVLTTVGVAGVAGWLWTIRLVTTDEPWVAPVATAMFVLGTGVALTLLLVKDSSGDTGLAPTLGWIGLLPCGAGLVAVVLLWRRAS